MSNIKKTDSGWMHLRFDWMQDQPKQAPWFYQRRLDENFTPPNFKGEEIAENYIFIGNNNYSYTDLGLEPDTQYFYRFGCLLNSGDVEIKNAIPQIPYWDYVAAKTQILNANQRNLYNVMAYGADPTGYLNSYPAFLKCLNLAKSAGGGTVYFPLGKFVMWPEDSSVSVKNGKLVISKGENYTQSFINGQTSNIIIKGAGPTKSFIKTRLHLNRSQKEYLTVLKTANGNPDNETDVDNIVRIPFWKVDNKVRNIVLEDINIDGGAEPVTNEKGWYTLADKKTQWDVSHKFLFGFGIADNILCRNVIAQNFRGEMCYWGGFGLGKYKIEDTILSRSNSSIISMSGNMEMDNVYCWDCANAAIECAQHSRNGFDDAPYIVSSFTGLQVKHDSIIRNSRLQPLRQDIEGLMKGLPGTKNHLGIAIFNQPETCVSISNTVLEEFHFAGFCPWYSSYNVFTRNFTIKNPTNGNSNFIYWAPNDKVDYKLNGGQENHLYINTKLEINKNHDNGGAALASYCGTPTQNDITIDGLHIEGNGYRFPRFWVESFKGLGGRKNFAFKNFSKRNLVSDTGSPSEGYNFIYNLSNSDRIHPTFENVDIFDQIVYPSAGAVTLEWVNSVVNAPNNTAVVIDKLNRYKPHQIYYVKASGGALILDGQTVPQNKVAELKINENSTSFSVVGILDNFPRFELSIDDPSPPPVIINPPTELEGFVNGDTVSLVWKDNADNESGYEIFRNEELIKTIPKDITAFVDANLQTNESYIYKIKAIDSGFSNNIIVFVPPQVVIKPPLNLQVTTDRMVEVEIKWTDQSEEEEGYRIFRREEGGEDLLLGTITPEQEYIYLDNVQIGKKYFYNVESFAGDSTSKTEAVIDLIDKETIVEVEVVKEIVIVEPTNILAKFSYDIDGESKTIILT